MFKMRYLMCNRNAIKIHLQSFNLPFIFSDVSDLTINVTLEINVTYSNCTNYNNIRNQYINSLQSALNMLNWNTSESLCKDSCNEVIEEARTASCSGGVVPLSMNFGLLRLVNLLAWKRRN